MGGKVSREPTVPKVPRDHYARAQSHGALRARRERFLFALHDRLYRLTNPLAIMEEASRILGEYLDANWVHYVEYDEWWTHSTIRRSHTRNGASSLEGRHSLEDYGPFVEAQRAGKAIVERDIEQSPFANPRGRLAYKAAGVRAFVAVPILNDGRLISSMIVAHSRVHDWTTLELALITETAHRTWAVVERVNADRKSQESEARLRIALDAYGLGTFVWRLDEGVGELDARMQELLGTDTPVMSLRKVLRIIVNPDDRRRLVSAVAQAITADGPGALREKIRVRHADGSERWLSIIGETTFGEITNLKSPGTLPERRAIQVSGAVADITIRKRREANLALLEEIATDFARLSMADDIMRVVGAKICSHLQASFCYLLDIDESRDAVHADYIWSPHNLTSLRDTAPISTFVTDDFRRAAQAGESLVVHDTVKDPRIHAEAFADYDTRSFIAVPFNRDGIWRSLFAVCDRLPHQWRDDEVELLREVSNRLVPRLERARAERAVANELRDTQLLRDLSARLVSESDSVSFFEAIGDAAKSITGALDASIQLVTHDGEGHVSLTVPRVVDGKTPPPHFTHLTPLVTRAGNVIGALTTWWPDPSPPSDRAMRFLDLLAHQAAEMVERHRATRALRWSEQQLSNDLADSKLLQKVSAQLIEGHGTASLYETIIDAAMSIMGSSGATLQVLSPERGDLHLIAHRGLSPEVAKAWEWIPPHSRTTCAEALRRGMRVVVHDMERCEFLRESVDLAAYRNAGVRSGQTTPLVSRAGSLVGMISTIWTRVHHPSERDLRLLDILARQAADLLERNQAEEALRRSERELKEADLRKDEFLATLAHELRNPLAPLRTSLELIRLAGDARSTVEEVRTMMEEQLLQLVRLVDDLLDVSRITSGKIRVHLQPEALTSLVQTAVQANTAALTAGRVSLHVDLPDESIFINADRTRFVQVVSNVLNNAVKFTDPGGHVSIFTVLTNPAEPTQGQVKLVIRDTGVGIPKEMLPRIFDRFTQVDDVRHRSPGGLGIGLAIARQLVELHGGTIRAESDGPGTGSTITIEMAVVTEVRSSEQPPPPISAPQVNRRVVVIDDNLAAATAMQRLVTVLGGQCFIAHDGETGLAHIRTYRPDIVILDIGLPRVDGYEVCRRIRAEFGPDLLVVALTGWGQDRDKRKAFLAGFDVHLTKPADPVTLEALLAGSPQYSLSTTLQQPVPRAIRLIG